MGIAIAAGIGVLLGIGLTVSTIAVVFGDLAAEFLGAPLRFIVDNLFNR